MPVEADRGRACDRDREPELVARPGVWRDHHLGRDRTAREDRHRADVEAPVDVVEVGADGDGVAVRRDRAPELVSARGLGVEELARALRALGQGGSRDGEERGREQGAPPGRRPVPARRRCVYYPAMRSARRSGRRHRPARA